MTHKIQTKKKNSEVSYVHVLNMHVCIFCTRKYLKYHQRKNNSRYITLLIMLNTVKLFFFFGGDFILRFARDKLVCGDLFSRSRCRLSENYQRNGLQQEKYAMKRLLQTSWKFLIHNSCFTVFTKVMTWAFTNNSTSQTRFHCYRNNLQRLEYYM